MTELVMWGQPASAGVADLPREGDGVRTDTRSWSAPCRQEAHHHVLDLRVEIC
jgi:hypothetical protein